MSEAEREVRTGTSSVRQAQVIYDSSRMDVADGVRGGSEEHRVLLYEAPGLSLDLVLHSTGERCDRVYGQLISGLAGEPVPGARLRWKDGEIASTTGQFGEFALDGPTGEGPWVLHVETDDAIVECTAPRYPVRRSRR